MGLQNPRPSSRIESLTKSKIQCGESTSSILEGKSKLKGYLKMCRWYVDSS